MAAPKATNYLIPIKQLLLSVLRKKKHYLFIRLLVATIDAENNNASAADADDDDDDAAEDYPENDKLYAEYYGVMESLTSRIINLAVGSNFLIEVTIVADFVYFFNKEVEIKSSSNPAITTIGRLFSLLLLQNCSEKFMKILSVTLPGLRSGSHFLFVVKLV